MKTPAAAHAIAHCRRRADVYDVAVVMLRPPADPFALTGTVLDGKFRVERAIAEGGFGVVYRSTHAILERTIALKVLKTPPDLPPGDAVEFNDGFVREAKAIVRINHPNIVQVLDFGISRMPAGVYAPWMALEWLDGRTLRDELRARRHAGGRSLRECFALMRPALEALAYAHQEGIAHRDIKPANLMLVTTKRGVEMKLLDFGIAKLMEEGEEAGTGETQTRSLRSSYSFNYAAPEQIGGTRTGPWTDVHAIALLLTEVLTDEAAIDGADRTEMCARILSPERPSPARRGVDAGPWEPVIRKALALRVADRYRDAGELLGALESALNVSPTNRALPARPVEAMVEIAGPDVPRNSRIMMPQVGAAPPGAPPHPPESQTTMRGAATSFNTGPAQFGHSPARESKAPAIIAALVVLIALGVGGAWAARERHRAHMASRVIAPPIALAPPPAASANVVAAQSPPAPAVVAPVVNAAATDAAIAQPAPTQANNDTTASRPAHRSHEGHAHGSSGGAHHGATGDETFDVN